MNVKSCCKGKHKRNIAMDPVKSSLDWKLDFLREFAAFLEHWEQSKQPGLTRETFLALRHSCVALADCAAFLIDRLGYNYVLLGNLQSDAIESRFGWFRQLSGANYFISTRQVMESDRKIRALSLVKFSRFSLADIDAALLQHTDDQQQCSTTNLDGTADSIVAALQYDRVPSASDSNVLYYVSDYIARSTIRTTKCEHCREVLVSPDQLEPIQLDESLDYSASLFLDSVNRGGLLRPSDVTFMLVLRCWRVYEEIRRSYTLQNQLLGAVNQRSLFVKIMQRAQDLNTVDDLIMSEPFCFKGHDLQDHIVRRFFNCAAKKFGEGPQ